MRLNWSCQTRLVTSLMGVNDKVINKNNNAQKPVERSINSIGLADKLSCTPNHIRRIRGRKANKKAKALIHDIAFLLGVLLMKPNKSTVIAIFYLEILT